MSKPAAALARVSRSRTGLLLGSAVALGLLLAGCAGSGRHSGGAPSGATPAASSPAVDSRAPSATGNSPAAPCKQWSCAPEQPEQLGGGYSVRLWSSPTPAAVPTPDRSTPVLQLLHDGQHRQWWVGRSGFGWSAKLDCLPGSAAVAAHCAVLAEVGSHAGTAELVILRSGSLVSPSRAGVSFDGGRPIAADLDGDGWLDVLGSENDYQPNYATGHNYWATYRFVEGSLERTGCALRRTLTEPPPDRLLGGTCPTVPPHSSA